jgi:hypothetical protein
VGTRSASIQVWIAAALLGANGAYLLIVNWNAHLLFAVAFGIPWIIAATVVILRKSWAKSLVFALTGLFVVTWFYYFILNIRDGALAGWSRGQIIVSLVPAAIPFVALAFSCKVVAKHMHEPAKRT